jgi:tellurite resistance protein TehA-like permease
MNELAQFLGLFVVVLAGGLFVTWVIASAIVRGSKAEVQTGRPSRSLRIIAIIFGAISGGLFVFELQYSGSIHVLWPVLALVLIGYGVAGLLPDRKNAK